MIAQSLMSRKPKSDVAKCFVGVLQRDSKGRAKELLVPGSEAKRYRVILRRPKSEVLTIIAECALEVGIGYIDCPGNSRKGDKGTICYHSRAAIDRAIGDAGYKASWAQSKDAAERVCRLTGGKLYRVASHQNGAEAWISVSERTMK